MTELYTMNPAQLRSHFLSRAWGYLADAAALERAGKPRQAHQRRNMASWSFRHAAQIIEKNPE